MSTPTDHFSTNEHGNPTDRSILIAVILLVGCLYAILFLCSIRLPLGHDTLQYLQLQYLFLNDLVVNGELPMWFPFMTKGTVTNLWFVIQNGLLNNFYYAISPFLEGLNYYYFFYLSLFFDELVLIVGTILLSRRLYQNGWTVFLVTITILGSVNWASQIWWNFHLYYMFPLVLYFYIRSFEDRSFVFFGLGNFSLFLWSFYGNLVYLLPLFSFTIFLFAAGYIAYALYERLTPKSAILGTQGNHRQVQINFSMPSEWLKWSYYQPLFNMATLFRIGTVICIGVLPFIIVYKYLTECGAGEIVYHNVERHPSGIVDLGTFLTYGGLTGYGKFLELFTGLARSIDQNLYAGMFMIPFFLLQTYFLFKRIHIDRLSVAFLVTIILMISFAAAGVVAVTAYVLWPKMMFFRHIGLVGSLIKVMMIFFAGFAVDQIIRFYQARDAGSVARSWNGVTIILVLIVIVKAIYLVSPIVLKDLGWVGHIYQDSKKQITNWQILSISGAVLWGGCYCFIRKRGRQRHRTMMLLFLAFLVQGVEIGYYRFQYINVQLPRLETNEFYNLLTFQSYDYVPERSQNYESNPRYAAFVDAAVEDPQKTRSTSLTKWGYLYWQSDSFFFFDPCGTMFRSHHRLNGVDDYYRLYQEKSHALNIEQPLPQNEAFLRIMGCDYPKLQGFGAVHFATQPQSCMMDPLYRGNILFTNSKVNESPFVKFLPGETPGIIGNDERVDLAVQIRHFSANRLGLEIVNSTPAPAVLHYADAYHKYWKASVNGERVDILRSNLAFKAVPVPPGQSSVEFVFREPKVLVALYFLIAMGLLGVAIVGYFTVMILIEQQKPPTPARR